MSAKPKFTEEKTPVPAWAILIRTGLALFFFGFFFTPIDIYVPMIGGEMLLYVLMSRAGIVFVVFAISFRTFQVVARRKGMHAEKAAMEASAADPLLDDEALLAPSPSPTEQSAKAANSVKAVPPKKAQPQP